MPPPLGRTWEMFDEAQVLHGPDEVDFKTMQPGDQLVVVTKNTRYQFDWQEAGGVLLQSNRPDRPWGQVTLTGCIFRRSGILAPDVVFRGGKLQYLTMDGRVEHRTTPIVALTVARQSERGALGETVLSGTAG